MQERARILGRDVEEALATVRTLLRSTLERYRDGAEEEEQVTVVDVNSQTFAKHMTQWLSDARASVEVVLTEDAEATAAVYSELRSLLARNVHPTVRVLCTPATLDRDFAEACRIGTLAAEVRLGDIPSLQAIIMDGETGLLCTDSASGRRSTFVQADGVAHTLGVLFEGMWSGAAPVGDRVLLGDPAREEFYREILGQLRRGVTDEVASRNLSMSVRTFRRHVARLMELLAANSRFECGVRAAETGLLAPVSDRHRPR